jgi:hypothetical protein
MPEHKYTPGPWEIQKADDAYCIASIGNLVIMPAVGKVKHDNSEADARLIAAAPELLDACTALIDYDESAEDGDVSMIMAYAKATRLARKAIAKATGQA